MSLGFSQTPDEEQQMFASGSLGPEIVYPRPVELVVVANPFRAERRQSCFHVGGHMSAIEDENLELLVPAAANDAGHAAFEHRRPILACIAFARNNDAHRRCADDAEANEVETRGRPDIGGPRSFGSLQVALQCSQAGRMSVRLGGDSGRRGAWQ
jgi:hypothetical protein